MTGYNFVQASGDSGDHWEFRYGDGKDRRTCEALDALRREGGRIGLAEFRARLERDGVYRPVKPIRPGRTSPSAP